jgi:two-component system CheB/CheR fusion protein
VKQLAPAGFGSTLIESAIPGAQVKREFRGDGLMCTIDVALPEPGQRAANGGT